MPIETLVIKFSVLMMAGATHTLARKEVAELLKSSRFFSFMADECLDICTQEELSVYCRGVVDGCPEGLWMVAQRGCGWLPRGVVDGCPEGLWMVAQRGCGWLPRGVVDGCPEGLWMVAQRGCGWLPRGVVDGCPERLWMVASNLKLN